MIILFTFASTNYKILYTMRKLTTLTLCLFMSLFSITSCNKCDEPTPNEPNNDTIIPIDGLIGYYPFENNTEDLSDEQNHGKDFTNGIYVDGIAGKAMYFNGTTDYIELNNSLDNTYGNTFSVWTKIYGLQSGQQNGTIISKYNQTGNNSNFAINTYLGTRPQPNYFTYFWYNAGSTPDTYQRDMIFSFYDSYHYNAGLVDDVSYTQTSYMQRPNLDAWQHLVVNLTSDSLQIYVNGKLTTSKKREYNTYKNSSIPTLIGNLEYGGNSTQNHYWGELDELRIYNRGLSEEEIQTLYEKVK